MGGGGGTKTTTVGTNRIPNLLKPYMTDLLTRGRAASNQVSDQPFSGTFNAPANPLEYAGAAGTAAVGNQLGTSAGQNLFDLGQKEASGYFLNPESNPYLNPMIQTTTNEIARQYQGQANNAVSSSIAGGAYGGDRGGLVLNNLASQTNRDIADATNKLLYGNYATERGYQQNAGDLIQQGVGLNLLGPELQTQAGADTRNLDQIALNEALAKFNEANAAPFRPLQPYADLIYGSNPLFRNTGSTSTAEPTGGSTWGSIIGAILGLASGAGATGLLGK